MAAERKGAVDKFAEFSQKLDFVMIGAAYVGAHIGLISVGFAKAVIDFSIITLGGAELIKRRKGNKKSSPAFA